MKKFLLLFLLALGCLAGCADNVDNSTFSNINPGGGAPVLIQGERTANGSIFSLLLGGCNGGVVNTESTTFLSTANTVVQGQLFPTPQNPTLLVAQATLANGVGGVRRAVELSINDNTGIAVNDTYNVPNVTYTESNPAINPALLRRWRATSGNVTVTSLQNGLITLAFNNLQLDPTVVTGNSAIGSLCVNGNAVVNGTAGVRNQRLQFRLNWTPPPNDLDSHLWLPVTQPFHVFFANQGSLENFPFARLDQDVVVGGTETVTITQFVPGTYEYSINNFSRTGTFSAANATVQITNEAGTLLGTVTPPNTPGNFWRVATIDGNTGVVTIINQILADFVEPYPDPENFRITK